MHNYFFILSLCLRQGPVRIRSDTHFVLPVVLRRKRYGMVFVAVAGRQVK